MQTYNINNALIKTSLYWIVDLYIMGVSFYLYQPHIFYLNDFDLSIKNINTMNTTRSTLTTNRGNQLLPIHGNQLLPWQPIITMVNNYMY